MLLFPGKSGIHGFGIFAKHPHKAGDMVSEHDSDVFCNFFIKPRGI